MKTLFSANYKLTLKSILRSPLFLIVFGATILLAFYKIRTKGGARLCSKQTTKQH